MPQTVTTDVNYKIPKNRHTGILREKNKPKQRMIYSPQKVNWLVCES